MTKTSSQPESADTLVSSLVAATQGGREEALQAWARGCDVYARYFAALSRADGPAAILAAQTGLLTDSVDVLTKNAAALQRLGVNGRNGSGA